MGDEKRAKMNVDATGGKRRKGAIRVDVGATAGLERELPPGTLAGAYALARG